MTPIHRLVSELSELLLGVLVDLGAVLGLEKLLTGSNLALVVCGALDLSPLLETAW